MTHSEQFISETIETARLLESSMLEHLVKQLVALRDRGGRLFLIGVGGSAGNCGHAVNDFRKLCGIETYAPSDNVSELTARANDEGWDTIFSSWLAVSKLGAKDALFVLSVGGGNVALNISRNIAAAVDFARERGAKVFGVVGRPEGHTARNGDCVVVIPATNAKHLTPLSEAFQSIVWHCLVSHPDLQIAATKW